MENEQISPVPALPAEPPKKKRNFLRFIWRCFKWSFFTLLFLIIALVTLVFVFEDDVKNIAIKELNKHLVTEVKVDPKDIDLTIFSTFPNAGLEFKKVIVYEALQKKNRDTIIDAGKISMQFNVKDLFDKKYNIKKILLADVKIKFLTDKNGKHNFIFWKESADTTAGVTEGGEELNFKLEHIDFENLEFSYRNKKEFIRAKGKSEHSSFSGSFSEKDFLLGAKGKLFFDELVLYKRSILSKKNVSYQAEADVQGKNWSLRDAEIAVNQFNLSAKGRVNKMDSIITCNLELQGKDVDVKSVLSLLPESQKEKIKDYQSEGSFYFKADLDGELSDFDKLNINVGFGIKSALVKHSPSSSELSNVNMEGEYVKPVNGKDFLSLKNISAQMNSNFIKGNCKLTDLSDPYVELNSSVDAQLAELIKFYPIDTIQSLTGKINLNFEVAGKIKDLKNDYAGQKESTKGNAVVSDLELLFKKSESPVKIKSGEFTIHQNDLLLKDVSINPEENDLLINGELKEFFAWLLKENQPLNILGSVKSNNIKIEKALAMFSGESSASDQTSSSVNAGGASSASEINISDKFNLELELNVAKASWKKFEAENVSGKLRVKNGIIFADDLSFHAFDGDVNFTGVADASRDKIVFNGSSELVAVNVNKLFSQFNNFDQDIIQDKHLKGVATVSIAFSTVWNKKLECDPSSINVMSDILIERGELIQYKPLEALSKYVELTELKNIKFSTLKSRVEIKDKVISISKTEIKSSAMNLNIFGTHSFNNEIEYHFSILMSELMARKPGKSKELDEELRLVENDAENKRTVFIVMTGTVDNPKFRYDRKAAKEKIKDDIKQEKQNLKQILKEEFGWFKKDTLNLKENSNLKKKAEQKFVVEFGNSKKEEEDKKKKEESVSDKNRKVVKKEEAEEEDGDDF